MSERCPTLTECRSDTGWQCHLTGECSIARLAGTAAKWDTPGRVITPGTAAGDPITITDPAAYAQSALERECTEVAGTHEGGRNHRLNAAAFSLGQLVAGGLPLAEGDVLDRLTEAGNQAGLSGHEVTSTIRSGLLGGARHPIVWTQGTATAATPAEPFTAPAGVTTTPAVVVDPYAQAVAVELSRQRAQREAKRQLDAEENAERWERVALKTVRTLTAEPDPEITWAIEGLLQVGSNALLTARFKAGKTTLLLNLARAVADRKPFLDAFTTHPVGRVAILDYELDAAMHRRWLREVAIDNDHEVLVGHWRGRRGRFDDQQNIDDLAEQLNDADVKFLIIDPFAAVAKGVDENDNGAVGEFLNILDHVKAVAGVTTLVLATHTGRREADIGKERARGATRLDDWPDARWLLTVDDSDRRYFGANGRDIDVAVGALNYDADKRWNSYTAITPGQVRVRDGEDAILDFVRENPAVNQSAIIAGVPGGTEMKKKALENLVRRQRLIISKGAHNANLYTIGLTLAAPFVGGDSV